MLRWKASVFETFRPSGKALVLLEALESLSLAAAYNAQKIRLTKLPERKKQNVFVATAGLARNLRNPGEIRMFCTWSQGVPTLLPRTHFIVLNQRLRNDKFRSALVSWTEVERIAGNLMKTEVTEDPPRIRVDDFPSDSQWRHLTEVAEKLS
jgi:hypothetical protein